MAARIARLLVLSCTVLVISGVGVRAQAQGQSQQSADGEFLKGAYLTSTPGLVAPKAIKTAFPKYTSDAMRAKLQGRVEIQAIVLPNGTVARARVVTSLDKQFGLDDEAVKAAMQWTFEPGRLDGDAVTVAVNVVLEFRLH